MAIEKNSSEMENQGVPQKSQRSCFPVFHWLTNVLMSLAILTVLGYMHVQRLDEINRVKSVVVEMEGLFQRVETILAAFDNQKFVAALEAQSNEVRKLQSGFVTDSRKLTEGLSGLNELKISLNSILSKDSQKIVSALEEQSKITREVQAGFKADANQLSASLKGLKKFETSLDSVFGDKKGESEQGTKLARQSWEFGDKDLAMVFLLNAISRDPGNIALHSQYVAWVKEINDPGTRQGAVAMLEKALYSVSPTDVRKVSEMLVELAPLPEGRENAEIVPPDQWMSEQLAQIEQAPISKVIGDSTALSSRIELLNEILIEMDDSVVKPEIKQKARDLLSEAQACLLATQVKELIALRLENVDISHQNMVLNQNQETETGALSALEAAEMAVNQVWNIPLGMLPAETQKEILRIPANFKEQATKIQELVENQAFLRAKKTWEAAVQKNWGNCSQRIEARQTAMQEGTGIVGVFRTEVGQKKARELVQDMAKDIGELKQKQYAAYQDWALKTIEQARARYNQPTVSTDKDAEAAFRDTEFRKIDRLLLSPEVGQFFQDVFAQILGEMDGENTANFQKEMAIPGFGVEKKKLEDF